MDDKQLEMLKNKLLEQQKELNTLLKQREETSQPVTLDQQLVGRVSRIDAIQQQQMASANKQAAVKELRAINKALELIALDDYGFCEACDKEIPFQRLLVKPASRLCVECQTKAE